MTKARTGHSNKVYCVELDMMFNNTREASQYVGCHNSTLSSGIARNESMYKKPVVKIVGKHWMYGHHLEDAIAGKKIVL